MPGPWKERQGLAIWIEVPEIDSSGLLGLAAIGFEVPEIDLSGLVGLAVIVFEVPEIDSSGLVGLAAIVFDVPEIDSSGLVGLAVLGSSLVSSTWCPTLFLRPWCLEWHRCCGFESQRAGSSKTTRGGQVRAQALISSSPVCVCVSVGPSFSNNC